MHSATISGVVTKYKGNGRKLGYPTANLTVNSDLKDGVYFGFASLAQYRNNPALIFIGTPTTVGDTDRRVEAYLLDIPDKDYYGENLDLTIPKFHRDNVTFSDIQDLIDVIGEDERQARIWFAESSIDSDRF